MLLGLHELSQRVLEKVMSKMPTQIFAPLVPLKLEQTIFMLRECILPRDTVSPRLSLSLITSHCLSLPLLVSHRLAFPLFIFLFRCSPDASPTCPRTLLHLETKANKAACEHDLRLHYPEIMHTRGHARV